MKVKNISFLKKDMVKMERFKERCGQKWSVVIVSLIKECNKNSFIITIMRGNALYNIEDTYE